MVNQQQQLIVFVDFSSPLFYFNGPFQLVTNEFLFYLGVLTSQVLDPALIYYSKIILWLGTYRLSQICQNILMIISSEHTSGKSFFKILKIPTRSYSTSCDAHIRCLQSRTYSQVDFPSVV